MHILLITYDFPPSPNAHAHRWFGAVEEWLSLGHTVEVISSLECSDPDARLIEHSGFNLIRVGNRRLNRLRQNHQLPGVSANAVPASIGSRFKGLLRRVYRAVYWPDGLWHWYPSIMRAIGGLPHPVYDLVISYSPTFVTHLAGMRLKRSGRALFWLADYGDPFSTSVDMPHNNLRLFDSLNRNTERQVLKEASAASYTNEKTLALYRETFDVGRHILLPHAVSFDEINAVASPDPSKASAIKKKPELTYLGAFHKTIREPGPTLDNLLGVLSAKPEFFSIKIVGSLNGVEIPGHPAIKLLPPVPRHEALLALGAADVLIHIENLSVPMSPSKVVDYIASGKPILNFHNGEVSPLLQTWPYALNLYVADDNTDTIVGFVESFGTLPPASPEQIADHLKEHDVRFLARRVLELVSSHQGPKAA